MNFEYDVIVVGGRVSGSSLAARLGMAGMRVLIVERQTFPALPSVSSPIIYASTMSLLDEIGADEADYARNTPRLHHMVTVSSVFVGKIRIPDYKGRDYAYAIDRARFDDAIWRTATAHPNVDGWQNFAVTDLLRDDNGRVCGIVGKHEGREVRVTARGVVGADGRFSVVARKAGAEVSDEHEDTPTSIYYAYWRNVAPFDADGAAAVAYEGDGTMGYLVMDSADGQTVVCIEGRSSTVDPHGDLEAFYLSTLKRNPALWARVEHAERVTTIRGMRDIGNAYRQPGGDGWALVGDAYHQKDPLDGQGIYDAVFTARVLASALKRWHAGKLTWGEALAAYDRVARMKTYPMYKTLQGRVRNSFYSNLTGGVNLPIPAWAGQKVGEWVMQDEGMSQLMGMMLTRQIPPDMLTLFAPPVVLGAIARGSLRELRQRLNIV
jgi:flavin-dependent dehydrogenase